MRRGRVSGSILHRFKVEENIEILGRSTVDKVEPFPASLSRTTFSASCQLAILRLAEAIGCLRHYVIAFRRRYAAWCGSTTS